MKTLFIIILTLMAATSIVQADTSYGHFQFDQNGCVRHLKAIAKAVKDAGGEVKKSDGSEKSYKMTLNGKTTIYTCTRHGLLETEL